MDYTIACNTNTLLIPNIVGGTPPYSYLWDNGISDSSLLISEGNYFLTITDFYGCSGTDEIFITEDDNPVAIISGGGEVCDDGSTVTVDFTFNGLLPWDLIYSNGSISSTINNITTSNYSVSSSAAGIYSIVLADDVNNCIADTSSFGKG